VQEIKGPKNLNVSWKALTEIMCRKLPDYAKFVLVSGDSGGKDLIVIELAAPTYCHLVAGTLMRRASLMASFAASCAKPPLSQHG